MISGKKVVAVIPARGGSKRLPRKNVLDLAGKPLIAWTIETAMASQYVDRVVVSTDDAEISAVSSSFGAEVPFLRPSEIAGDTATTNDVIAHALNELDDDFSYVVILQPTSPLRASQHVDEALEKAILRSASAIISVTPCEHSPLWANTLTDDGSMDGFLDAVANTRSQDLPQYYRLNGAIYVYAVEPFLENKLEAYGSNSFAYEMPNEYSIDIDTELDFQMAAFLMERLVSDI